MDSPRARRALVVCCLLGLFGLVLLAGPPVCPTALLLGIPCPGCGLTRAALALLRGDVANALHFHPLVFVLAPLLAAALGGALFEYVRGGPTAGGTRFSAWLATRAGYTVAFGLLFVTIFVWGARFTGLLGGPAPVESLRDLVSAKDGRRQ